MADPIQTQAKDKRRAEALRANLKRRKEQARGAGAEPAEDEAQDAPPPPPGSANRLDTENKR